MARFHLPWEVLVRVWKHDIWQVHPRPAFRGQITLYRVLRVISTTLTSLINNRVTSRAAALSFSTLLSLGPLVAIVVLISGFAIAEKDPQAIAAKVDHFLRYIAPPVSRLAALEEKGQSGLAQNPGVVEFIRNSISGAQSNAAGALSIVTLIFIVLMLFSSVEDVFNDIWGVRRGRNWLMRIVFYWTILTLGAVIFFAAVGGLSAVTFINFFTDRLSELPFGPQLVVWARVALPLLSIGLMVGILTLCYRFIPNTHVYWRSAASGAVLVTVLLIGNNLLAFSYFRRVDLTRSLYGSLSFIPILMLGLYVFWLFILIGGIFSYAVQNARFRTSQALWANLSESARERLTLIVYLTLARRFHGCLPPCTLTDLGKTLRVPTQLLNESLNRLVDFGLVTPVPPAPHAPSSDYLYQPARPLDRVTLGDFKRQFETSGDDPAGEALAEIDPIGQRYHKARSDWLAEPLFQLTIQDLIEAHGIDGSRPPFHLGKPSR